MAGSRMTRSKTGLNSLNKLGAQVCRYAISTPRMGAGVRLAFCDLGQGQPPLQAAPVHPQQTEITAIPQLWTLLGEGNGSPLQYSCLENPMDGEAWRRLLSMGSQRVGHDWATSLAFFFFMNPSILLVPFRYWKGKKMRLAVSSLTAAWSPRHLMMETSH